MPSDDKDDDHDDGNEEDDGDDHATDDIKDKDDNKNNFVGDTLAMAAVWTPLHMINFRFIPLTHRFPFVATAGIIWTTVFSYLQFGTERT